MPPVKKIDQKLSVAPQINSEQLQQAAREGFKSVLNLRSRSVDGVQSPDEEGFLENEQQQSETLGLDYVNIPVKMDSLSDELTTKILQKIDELPNPALIHCGTAKRAGAMALMHLATRRGITAEQAFQKAEAVGFDCSANPKMKEFFKNYVEKHSEAS